MTLNNEDSGSQPLETDRGSRRLALSGVAAFEMDLGAGRWEWSPEVAALFGFETSSAPADFQEWQRRVFVDDVPKIRAALDAAKESGAFYVEFRVANPDGPFRWLAGKGHVVSDPASGAQRLRGTYADINERKQLEARLLSVNETLEARVGELRAETRALEVLNRTGTAIGA